MEDVRFLFTRACCTHPLVPGEQDGDSLETGQPGQHSTLGTGQYLNLHSYPMPSPAFTPRDPGEIKEPL